MSDLEKAITTKKLEALSDGGLQGFLDFCTRHGLKELETLTIQVKKSKSSELI